MFMRTFGIIATLLMLLGGGACAASLQRPSETVRYQITVSFDYGGKLLTGSSVWETQYVLYRDTPYSAIRALTRGDAIVIPTQDNTVVFALRRRSTGSTTSGAEPLLECLDPLVTSAEQIKALAAFSGPCQSRFRPMLVEKGPPDQIDDLVVVPIEGDRTWTPSEVGVSSIHAENITVTAQRTNLPLTEDIAISFPWILQTTPLTPDTRTSLTTITITSNKIYQSDFSGKFSPWRLAE